MTRLLAVLASILVSASCSANREAPAHPTSTTASATTSTVAPIVSAAPTTTSGGDPCAECKAGMPPVQPNTLCCTIVGNGWVAMSCQTKSVCDDANAKAAAETEKAGCKSPGDCPAQKACVVGSLGGAIGCTDATCCGAAECTNGCRTDADCPSCRPKCKRESKTETTGTCGSGSPAP
jgi:hypothetical protein